MYSRLRRQCKPYVLRYMPIIDSPRPHCRATIAPMPTSSETPIRRQYLDIKRHYPHAIVFFRLGDFYETFDDDAVLVSKELEITLTSKPMGKDLRVPLAGFPYHSLQVHVKKLVSRGFKVAVCEQME